MVIISSQPLFSGSAHDNLSFPEQTFGRVCFIMAFRQNFP